ncbi:MAG: hypothetical protein N2Z72_08615 [Bacteroidales bacterium]|nr:hypothetical protein [Bacteroidales bacterium]
MRNNHKKFFLAVFFWLSLIITWMGISLDVKWWKTNYPIIRWDVISYYGYLPAVFIFKDIKLNFVEKNPELPVWFEIAPNQNRVFKTSMGMAFLYMPFFTIGHFIAWLRDEPLTGYTKTYEIAIVFAALFYLIAGIYFLKKVLEKFVEGPGWIYFILFVIVFGGNLLYYVAAEPGMPHVYIFSLVSMFLHTSIRWYENPNWLNSLIIGLLIGILSLVRPTNLIWIFFWILYGITSWKALIERIIFLIKQWYKVGIIILGILVIWFPQMFYWKYLTGNWLYYSYGEERFYFLKPHVWEALFSFRKGFFVYAPVMILFIPGLFYLYRQKKELFWGTMLVITFFIYVYASWWCWWFGGSYGMRAYIDMYPLIAIPLTFTINVLLQKKNFVKYTFLFFTIILLLYQIWNTFKYIHGSIHWDAMSGKVFWMNFFKLRPTDHMLVYLEYPSYEKALKNGENLTTSYANEFKTMADTLLWNIDTIPSNLHFPYKISFSDSGKQLWSSQKSFSGKQSLLLHGDHTYSPALLIDSVKQGDILFVTLKSTSSRNLILVVQAYQNPELFYYQRKNALKINRNWFEIAAFVETPVDIPRLAIYAYSLNEKEHIWVDDLMVILLRKNNY